MCIERFFCSGNERRMIGEPQIIVGTHVQHAFATGNGDVGILGCGNHPLGFEETLRFNFFECLRKLFFEFSDHK